jgi:O-antigen/teichoic acid export membrane protein
VFTQASQPLYKVIYPELTKLWELGKLVEFGQTIRQFSIYASIFGAVTWLAFFLAPNTVIYYTVGEEYYDSIPTLLFYLAGVVLSVGTFPLTPALLAMGKATETFNVLLISTVVYFCSFFLMINEIGLLGAGISYLIFYIVWSTLMFFKIKKFL